MSNNGATGSELTGQIVTLELVDGLHDEYQCGLEDCECPDHEFPPHEPGTYITIRLDEHARIGFSRVSVRLEGQSA